MVGSQTANLTPGLSFGFIPSLFCTPKGMRCDSRSSFLAHILASLCFGHEPKAKVMTLDPTLALNKTMLPCSHTKC
ncbi:unnamed protein product [Sphagnum balticum]